MHNMLDMCWRTRYALWGERSYIISKREALYRIFKENISILCSKNIDCGSPPDREPIPCCKRVKGDGKCRPQAFFLGRRWLSVSEVG